MTLSKERLTELANFRPSGTNDVQSADREEWKAMAAELLERRERDGQEPVAWAHRLVNRRNGVVHPWVYGSAEASPSEGDLFRIEVMPLYAAPQPFGNSEQLNSPAVPDGWMMVPKRLTAENGAKAALVGEFNLEYSLTCHECFGEGCDDCSGEGSWTNTIPIDWTTIKNIWAKAINHFAAAPKQEPNQ